MAFDPSKDFGPVYNLILQNCVSIITYVCIIINTASMKSLAIARTISFGSTSSNKWTRSHGSW